MNSAVGQRMVMPVNGNLTFAQGAIEQLAGDNNLIAVRSRASRERPFTVVKKMQAEAEANYRSKIKELEAAWPNAAQAERTADRSKEGGQRFILSPEQQQEIANFRKKEAEVKLQLKQSARTARRHRLAREPHQVAEHRGHARRRRRWLAFGLAVDETQTRRGT